MLQAIRDSKTGSLCPICHSDDSSTFEEGYLRCRHCGSIFSMEHVPQNFQNATDAFYRRKDALCVPPRADYAGADIERDLLIKSKCNIGSALDIGAGNGNFLALLTSMGFDGWGIEPNAPRAAVARSAGMRINDKRFNPIELESFGPAKFDLISMRDSICYLDDLDSAMQFCSDRLQPGGSLYIRILFADSPYFRFKVGTIAGRVSSACTVLMSERALYDFVEKSGFEITAKRTFAYPANEILRTWKIPAIIRRLFAALLDRTVMRNFTPDYALIIARRRTI